MNASIFFRNLTCLDHSFIDRDGMVRGCSYHVSATVTGKVTEDEHVVLDFSAGKKQIKATIDDNKIGYDHKLVIYPRSKIEVMDNIGNGLVHIKTPYVDTIIPHDAMQLALSNELSLTIQELLHFKFPDLKFEVELNQHGFSKTGRYFHYAHGLKNSSSYGCQNIHHGHTSFVEVFSTKTHTLNPALCNTVANLFNDMILVFRENVVEETKEYVEIEVETNLRGIMSARYFSNNILIMDTETTIEYMAQYAATKLKEQLKGYTLFISEGLQKGCRIVCE